MPATSQKVWGAPNDWRDAAHTASVVAEAADVSARDTKRILVSALQEECV
jgi:hypothetical protein